MVNKYARVLESREINVNTGEVWSINDVPNTWKKKTEARVISDGYHFAEDGTAYPNDIPVKEEETEE
jgi:hypothetical protein